jgi:hypothetical protein
VTFDDPDGSRLVLQESGAGWPRHTSDQRFPPLGMAGAEPVLTT